METMTNLGDVARTPKWRCTGIAQARPGWRWAAASLSQPFYDLNALPMTNQELTDASEGGGGVKAKNFTVGTVRFLFFLTSLP